jgi:addiction module RelE/StbE family toxin
MKKRIVWTDSSFVDLQLIHDYISNDAETYAPVFISELMEKVNSLPDFPEIGKKVPEKDDKNIREIFFNSYRIIYKISSDRIEIVSVVHQRMKI